MKKFVVVSSPRAVRINRMIALGLCLFIFGTANAQKFPLHLEVSTGIGTQNHQVIPFNATIDLNYPVVDRWSLHAATESNWMLPKEGVTKDFNSSINVGGGISYSLFPTEVYNKGTFETRVMVTETVDNSVYKHTSYNVGLYWYKKHDSPCPAPLIGVGFCDREYHSNHRSSYRGAFLTFGVRL
jgi:hypothetical protein